MVIMAVNVAEVMPMASVTISGFCSSEDGEMLLHWSRGATSLVTES